MMRVCWVLAVVCSLVLSGAAWGDSEPGGVPALALLEIGPNDKVFEEAGAKKPLQIKSAEEAKAYFEGKQLEALNKEVDWEWQTVLVFAWHGSGGDKLDAEVKRADDGEVTVQFHLTRGMTRDLRPHKYVYAVRQGVEATWLSKTMVEPAGVSAVSRIAVSAKDAVFNKAAQNKPLELGSGDDAAAYFDAKQLAFLNKEVDWDKQTVLIFAWHGSGGDKMEAQEQDAEAKVSVEFQLTYGLTMDLQPHVYVYAVRKGVDWTWREMPFE